MKTICPNFLVVNCFALFGALELFSSTVSEASLAGVSYPTAAQLTLWQKQNDQAILTLIELPANFPGHLYLTNLELDNYLKQPKTPAADKKAINAYLARLKEAPIDEFSVRLELSAPHVFIATNFFPETFFSRNVAGEDRAPVGLQELTQSIFHSVTAQIPELKGWSLHIDSHTNQPDMTSFIFPLIKDQLMQSEETYRVVRLKNSLGDLPPAAQQVFVKELAPDPDAQELPMPNELKTLLIAKLQAGFEAQTSLPDKRISISASFLRDLFSSAAVTMPWKKGPLPLDQIMDKQDEATPEFRQSVDELMQKLTFVVLHECGHVARGSAKELATSEVECDLWALAQQRRFFDTVNDPAILNVMFPLGARENFISAIKGDVTTREVGELITERKNLLMGGMYLCKSVENPNEAFDCLLKCAREHPNKDIVLSQALGDPATRPKALMDLTKREPLAHQIALILIGEEKNPPEELRDAVKKAATDPHAGVINAALEAAKKLAIELPDPREEIIKALSSNEKNEIIRGWTILNAHWKMARGSDNFEQAEPKMFRTIISAYVSASTAGKKQLAGFVKKNIVEMEGYFNSECPKLDEPSKVACAELLEKAKKKSKY